MTAARAHHADLHHPTVTAGTLEVYCFHLGETLVLQVRTSSCSSSQPLKAQTKAAIRAHNLLHLGGSTLGTRQRQQSGSGARPSTLYSLLRLASNLGANGST